MLFYYLAPCKMTEWLSSDITIHTVHFWGQERFICCDWKREYARGKKSIGPRMKLTKQQMKQACGKNKFWEFSSVPGVGGWGLRQCFKTCVPHVIKTKLLIKIIILGFIFSQSFSNNFYKANIFQNIRNKPWKRYIFKY